MLTFTPSATPPRAEYLGQYSVENIQTVMYGSAPYQGKPTRVFACLGFPDCAEKEPVPAVVLVHGGGGTAFPQWVKQWTRRGYAALAIDTEGHIPVNTSTSALEFICHNDSGPSRQGEFFDIDQPLEEQWGYHALHAISNGLSLLRADKRILPDKIGLCGISWGGMLTSLSLCLDPRFAFALPIYGCGFLSVGHSYFRRVFENPKIKALYDPSEGFQKAKLPVLWINGGSDYHFPPSCTSLSANQCPNGRMFLSPDLAHGHDDGWAVEDTYVFADSICRNTPLITITGQTATALAYEGLCKEARLIWSPTGILYTDSGCETQWATTSAVIVPKENRVTWEVPPTAKCYFINLTDAQGFTISSSIMGL